VNRRPPGIDVSQCSPRTERAKIFEPSNGSVGIGSRTSDKQLARIGDTSARDQNFGEAQGKLKRGNLSRRTFGVLMECRDIRDWPYMPTLAPLRTQVDSVGHRVQLVFRG
jgi:hypothetical protein